MASNDNNGSKRRKTHHLDQRYVFFVLFRILLILANDFYLFRFNLCSKQRKGLGLAGDNDNRPK